MMKIAKGKMFLAILLAAFFMLPAAVSAPTAAFKKGKQTLGDTRSFGIAIADVDLDGDNDVFITNYLGPNTLWLNDGKGNFIDSGQTIGAAADSPNRAVLGDIDNDGDADAFITNYQVPNRLWLNNGKGFFTITPTKYSGANGHKMELTDFNGDGSLDLYLCLSDQSDQVWLNDGAGHFKDSGQALGGNVGIDQVDSGDVDGDGDIDLVTANGAEGVKVWLNRNNSGTFVPAGPSLEPGLKNCQLFDADLDGDLDLVTLDRSSGNCLWLNNGSGSFTSLGPVFGTIRAPAIAIGNLDGDVFPDVVLGKIENLGGNEIYFNRSVKK